MRTAANPWGTIMRHMFTKFATMGIAALGLALSPLPLAAQMTEVDPNTVLDSDLDNPQPAPPPVTSTDPYADPALDSDLATDDEQTSGVSEAAEAAPATPIDPQAAATNATPGETYKEDDLIGAAEGVFGKGAQGLAGLIEDILKKQGEPNAYIVGREASGAIGLGLRLWIAGLVIWAIGHAISVWAARRDPQFVDVARRHLRFPTWMQP